MDTSSYLLSLVAIVIIAGLINFGDCNSNNHRQQQHGKGHENIRSNVFSSQNNNNNNKNRINTGLSQNPLANSDSFINPLNSNTRQSSSTTNVYRYEPIVLLEEPPIGTLIIDLSAKLGLNLDTSEYKFRFYSPNSVSSHYFLIDQLTGHVKTQRSIDREYLCESKICGPCSTNNCTLILEIVAASPVHSFPMTNGQLNVSSSDGLPSQKFVSFDVIIEDKNEFAPQFPQTSIVLNISEAAPPNFVIPLEPAVDRDSKPTVITYSLAPLNSNFKVGESNSDTNSSTADEVESQILNSKVRLITNTFNSQLSLVIIEPFDYEEEKEFSFKLLASDSGWPILTGTCLITLKIIDVNDNLPIFDRQEYEYRVDEGVLPGTRLVRVHATDKDDGLNGLVTYSFAENARSPDKSYQSFFSIDENTGWISANAVLDYEVMPTYRLVVKAQDHGANSMPVYASATIYLNDLNDNPPKINLTVPEDTYNFENNRLFVSEWTLPGTFLAQIVVTDPDSQLNGQVKIELSQFEKKLNSESFDQETHIFSVEHLFNNIYSLMLKNEVDREKCSEYQLTLKATDFGSPPLSTTFSFRVIITDENDNAPKFVYPTYEEVYRFSVRETNVSAMNPIPSSDDWVSIGKVEATDADFGENAKLTYEIREIDNSKNGDDANASGEMKNGRLSRMSFKINPETGEIKAFRLKLDRETQDLYEFKVICHDGGSPRLETETKLFIKILDINDNEPRFSQLQYTINVFEDMDLYSKIIQLNATDADEPLNKNSAIRYIIITDEMDVKQVFNINEEKGEIFLISKLDYENRTKYEFKVMAYDLGETRLSSVCSVIVNVLDVNDNAPRVIWPTDADMPLTFNLDLLYSRTNGSDNTLLQINASDLDSNENAKLKYVLEKQQKISFDDYDKFTSVNLFDVDQLQGAISGSFLKRRKVYRWHQKSNVNRNDDPNELPKYYKNEDNLFGIYYLEVKISDSAKLNPLSTYARVFIALSSNTTEFNESIKLLKAILNSNRDDKESFDKRIVNFRKYVKESLEKNSLNDAVSRDLFSLSQFSSFKNSIFGLDKGKLSENFIGRNYKLILLLFAFATITIVFIIISVFVTVCYRRQKNLFKKRKSIIKSALTIDKTNSRNDLDASENLKVNINDNLIDSLVNLPCIEVDVENENKCKMNLLSNNKDNGQNGLKNNSSSTTEDEIVDLNTSSEDQAALIYTNSPSSSASQTSGRPSQPESYKTGSSTSMLISKKNLKDFDENVEKRGETLETLTKKLENLENLNKKPTTSPNLRTFKQATPEIDFERFQHSKIYIHQSDQPRHTRVKVSDHKLVASSDLSAFNIIDNENRYRTLPSSTNARITEFDTKTLNTRKAGIEKRDINTFKSAKKHSPTPNLARKAPLVKSITEISEDNLLSQEELNNNKNNDNSVPEYFFKDEKELKKLLYKHKINCKQVTISGNTTINSSNSNNSNTNECFL